MRTELEKFLTNLGVNHVLSPYETHPWLVYDEEKRITCSAEVRMGKTGEDIEAEIQFLHDEIPEESEEDQGDETAGEGGNAPSSLISPEGREQIFWMRAEPISGDQWTVKSLRIKGKDYVNEFHNWQEKGCEFFLACVGQLQINQLPDIESLIEDKMRDDTSWGGGKRGQIGRKSPKIKPGSLLGMKK